VLPPFARSIRVDNCGSDILAFRSRAVPLAVLKPLLRSISADDRRSDVLAVRSSTMIHAAL
jgi:hypothetical protein